MNDSLGILKKVWGHSQFRPLQKEIVDSVVQGNDVLALLPTGGGKSICFQVPALMTEGVCIVITPLIALMKDQVEHLKSKGINAEAIYSGLNKREIDILLDNCIYGKVKFLYVSPERLLTELMIERVRKMNVNLLVVDEAHCVSQWGYDFRPPYLRIAEFRTYLPNVNMIALTATATDAVKMDIIEKLNLNKVSQFQASFERSNLSYSVRRVEDKQQMLLEILSKVKGTAVVYVNSRKAAKEVAQLLFKNGVSADFYHAGLPFEQRGKKHNNWINNKTRVIVATNAFGMGIDKPDVRLVIHMDLPMSLEAYYQEAGRAGRDGNKAYAVVLYYKNDIVELNRKMNLQFPTIELIKRVYQCLANYYKIAVGSATEESYDFELSAFAELYKLDRLETYYAIKKLEEEGLVLMNESFHNPSRLLFLINNKQLYEFLIANARYDHFLKTILRLYGGELFSNLINVNENQIAKMAGMTNDQVVVDLKALNDKEVLFYEAKKDKPQFSFVGHRYDVASLPLDKSKLAERRKVVEDKIMAMTLFIDNEIQCRTQQLLYYFGEIYEKRCGVCDNCIAEKKRFKENSNIKEVRSKIITILGSESVMLDDLVQAIQHVHKEELIDVIRQMLDFGEVKYDEVGKIVLM